MAMTKPARTWQQIRDAELAGRIDRVVEKLDDLDDELADEFGGPDVDGARACAARIRDLTEVVALDPALVFAEGDGVLLGEENDAALLLGHREHPQAAELALAQLEEDGVSPSDIERQRRHLTDNAQTAISCWSYVFFVADPDPEGGLVEWWVHCTLPDESAGDVRPCPVTHVQLW